MGLKQMYSVGILLSENTKGLPGKSEGDEIGGKNILETKNGKSLQFFSYSVGIIRPLGRKERQRERA